MAASFDASGSTPLSRVGAVDRIRLGWADEQAGFAAACGTLARLNAMDKRGEHLGYRAIRQASISTSPLPLLRSNCHLVIALPIRLLAEGRLWHLSRVLTSTAENRKSAPPPAFHCRARSDRRGLLRPRPAGRPRL